MTRTFSGQWGERAAEAVGSPKAPRAVQDLGIEKARDEEEAPSRPAVPRRVVDEEDADLSPRRDHALRPLGDARALTRSADGRDGHASPPYIIALRPLTL